MNIADIAARAMRPVTPTLSPAKLTIKHPTARIGFLPTTSTLATSPPEALRGSPRLAVAVQHRFPLLLAPSVVEQIRGIYGGPDFPYECVGTELDGVEGFEKWSDLLASSPKVFDRME